MEYRIVKMMKPVRVFEDDEIRIAAQEKFVIQKKAWLCGWVDVTSYIIEGITVTLPPHWDTQEDAECTLDKLIKIQYPEVVLVREYGEKNEQTA